MHWTIEQDPTQGSPLNAWHIDLQSRTPARRGPSRCLTHQTIEKSPSQGRSLSTWTGRAMEKDWPKRPSDCQLKRAQKKDSDRAITPVAEAICVPAHFAPPGSPQAKHLCHLHTQLSLGQSCHRQKKKKYLASICAGSLWSYPTLCNPVDCGLPGFSARGVLQARILECTGQYWLPYSSRALYSLLP